ncbi:MAG: glycoside hydrolase domain-containing protein [Planctomycetota bacterium]
MMSNNLLPLVRCLTTRRVFWGGGFLALLAFVVGSKDGVVQGQNVPNADFQQAAPAAEDEVTPAGWSLSGTEGEWLDEDVLTVNGNGEDHGYWSTRVDGLEPGRIYRFSFRARRLEGSEGSIVSGPRFANCDHRDVGSEWSELEQVFRVPEGVTDTTIRLGHWKAKGAIQFDWVKLAPAIAVRPSHDVGVLGERESIVENRYRFSHPGNRRIGNAHRNIWKGTAGFNTYRWTFGTQDAEVIYRLAVPGHPFTSGTVVVNVNYHRAGTCRVEVSRDGKEWDLIGERSEVGRLTGELPADLLPAKHCFLRVKPASGKVNFQVNKVDFEGDLQGDVPSATGWTSFAEVAHRSQDLRVEQVVVDLNAPDGNYLVKADVKNLRPTPVQLALTGRFGEPSHSAARIERPPVEIKGETASQLVLPFPDDWAGDPLARLTLLAKDEVAWSATGTVKLPDYFRSNYGARIAGIEGATAVWWADAARKIPPSRAVPGHTSQAATLSAARNDYEAVQVVVRPQEKLTGLTAKATALSGPGGAKIAADEIEICRVYYHMVTHPTDSTGIVGPWPDALPPLDDPIDVEAGKNQPLWILVHVPTDAAAGDYTGRIELAADGFSASVPLRLHVWDFALPETNRINTAFGLRTRNIHRYHQLESEADRRRVMDMYHQLMSEHRISPYDPTPYDPWRVEFKPEADPPRAETDFSDFDPAMRRAIERFNFTNFRLRLEGIGWGSWSGHGEGKIEGFEAGTPEYEAMFASQARRMESHLKKNGWLDMAYLYWFDEPHPEDYPFVRDVMNRVEKAAPGIPRFLTEQPEPELYGAVDIWCPVSPRYDHKVAEERRQHGDEFWWYVCTGPKAPYCTLFIDHPASELRVWLWQTWKRDITGVLVWSINYWTSPAEYTDHAQNPYEDPMGYRSRYDDPEVKQYWGNGDGRFLYPPLAAAEPGVQGEEPVIEPPVSSIRLEMLREGIEDYEMLWTLRDLLSSQGQKLSAEQRKQYENLLEVPPEITRSMTDFTTDSKPILEHRRQVAEAIERLMAHAP